MRKSYLLLLLISALCYSPLFSQPKKSASSSKQTVVSEKPEAGDKVIKGKKGPEGQEVYEGIKGGIYYINKNGNRTYLKENDKVVSGKKGPDGQKVYAGPQGGEYYINKNGNKVYLKNSKK